MHLKYVDGLVDEEYITREGPQLVVIDDLMTELGNDRRLANLFTKGSHHLSISVIFIVQNIFHQAQQMRTISLNSHYLLILKNPRDKSQIVNLSRQLYPTNIKFLQRVYQDATSKPYGYILLDLTPDTPEELRCRTLITPDDVPKKYKSISKLCPVIYQPDGNNGEFTKSVSIIEGEDMDSQDGAGYIESNQDEKPKEVDIPQDQLVSPDKATCPLRDCLHRLDAVARTKGARKRALLLREMSHDHKIADAMQFLAQNTINMRIPLDRKHKVKLVKHHTVIRNLARKNISKQKKKELISQSGGWLPTLIPIVLSLASHIYDKLKE